jgi:tetratricopeptide (TPR) repeat protein
MRDDTFQFFHGLTRDAAYHATLATNRLSLHQAAAVSLEAQIVPGTAEELPLRQQLLMHLTASQLWGEAHACACAILELMADSGRLGRWDETLAIAQRAWALNQPAAAAEAGLDAALPEPEAQSALLLNALATRENLSADFAAVERLSSLALEAARREGLPGAAAWALMRLGVCRFDRGEPDAAFSLLDEGLATARAGGDWHAEAKVLAIIGGRWLRVSDYERAWANVAEARELYRRHGNLRGQAQTLVSWALGKRQLGQFSEAHALLGEAIELARACGDRRLESWLLGNKANLLALEGDRETAVELCRSAIALLTEMGDRATVAQFRGNLGCFYDELGQDDEAQAQFESALVEQRQMGDLHQVGITLGNLGGLWFKQRKLSLARAALEEATTIFDSLGDRLWGGWAWSRLGRIRVAAGDAAAAEAAFREAHPQLQAGGEPIDLLELLVQWVQLRLAGPAGDPATAAHTAELLAEARTLAQRSEDARAAQYIQTLDGLAAAFDSTVFQHQP